MSKHKPKVTDISPEVASKSEKVAIPDRIRRVRLLGKGTGWDQCPDRDPKFELWGLNGLLFANKKLDRIFMMDILDEMPSVISGTWELKDLIEQANKLAIPLISPYKYEEIPTSEAFPIEEAVREFGIPYFNNTIAFMICYALLHGVQELEIWGINQASGTEYFYEKGCVEYWLGVAMGMGVKVSIHGKHSELLSNKERYGGQKLYGYNVSYEQIIRAKERFGDFNIKKLIAPTTENRVMFLGPEKSKGLRTSDIMGVKKIHRFFTAPNGVVEQQSRWTISENDAMNISRYVLDHKPKRILDLGTGIGTSSAVAKYTNKEAEVVSIEQFAKVAEIARENMKKLGLDVNVLHKEPVLFSLPEMPGQVYSGFEEIPKGPWDMVIVDGPGPFKHDGVVTEKPNGDIFRILNDVRPGGIVYVDGRHDAVKLMLRYLQPFLRPTTMGQSSSLFVRTDLEYKPELIKDALLDSLEKEHYF